VTLTESSFSDVFDFRVATASTFDALAQREPYKKTTSTSLPFRFKEQDRLGGPLHREHTRRGKGQSHSLIEAPLSLMMVTALRVLYLYIILFPRSLAFVLTGEVVLPSLPRRDSSFSLRRASSLNHDGDFCIPGINDDENDNQSASTINGSYLSSLLDVDYASNDQDCMSAGAQPQPMKQRSIPTPSNSNELHGLTDDGDFMMVGINAQDPMFTAERESSPSSSQAMNDPMTSFLLGGPHNNNPDPIVEPAASPINTIHSYQDEEQIGVIEEFLSSLFPPTLYPNELKQYAHQLCALGFDPDCETSGELQYEDLDFMKPLYQRYFWKQWEKLQ
jgi:hypothetical protein